jgi:hypothetical protein
MRYIELFEVRKHNRINLRTLRLLPTSGPRCLSRQVNRLTSGRNYCAKTSSGTTTVLPMTYQRCQIGDQQECQCMPGDNGGSEVAGSAVMSINVLVCAFIIRTRPSAVINTDLIASVSQ